MLARCPQQDYTGRALNPAFFRFAWGRGHGSNIRSGMILSTKPARLILALLAAAWLVVVSAPPGLADEGWIINAFHSDIVIAPDSTLTVTEGLEVDFGSLQKHGIFRTIPLRYRYDNQRDRYYVLDVKSVTDGNRALPYETSVSNDNEVIKIGDPNRLVSGKQRYIIQYSVSGVLNSFAEHDELFWNVDGALWPVPKAAVSATVHVPSGSLQQATCFQGPPGSTDACSHVESPNAGAFSSTRQLASGEEMSVVVAINKGAVIVPPPLLEPRQRQFPQDAFDLTPLTVALFVLLTVLGVGLVAWNWWVHGRDRAYLTQHYLANAPPAATAAAAEPERTLPLVGGETLVVEFGPPQNMRPAELGLILDESADTKDVTATIVDLAVRGYLTIAEDAGKADWTLAKKGGPMETLLPYERTLFYGLFSGRETVKLSDLKGTFAPTLRQAEGQIYADSLSRRWFTSSPTQARAAWGCLGFALVLVGFAATVSLGLAFGWGLVGLAIVISGIVLAATFPFMPQRTAAGRDLLQHTLGFRLYMTTAEKYRQQFAEKAQIFTQLLPYAIVFGCVTQWAKAFEGIDTAATNSGWYVGNAPFQAALLASSLESMNTNISSAITYVPPSSGSSSGFSGGFSGGGGGGGGGGSW
jgi:type II secretory pathway pseudopilin PulG